MSRTKSVIAAVAVLGALFMPMLLDVLGQPAILRLITRILIYAIAVASLNFILGYGGLVSFGHAAFFGIGGYAVAILDLHHHAGAIFGLIPGTDSFLVAVPVAMLVAGIAAALVGALSLRTSGVQFIMITLAFAQMLFFFFVSLRSYGGEDGIIMSRANALLDLNMRDRQTIYYVVLAVAAAYFLFQWRLVNSSFGTIIRGIRQNERRMIALGIPVYLYKLVAFALAGMGAGLAGALMANFSRFVSPDMLHWTLSGDMIIMMVLGGVGTLAGPILGAAAFVFLESQLAAWTEHWKLFMGLLLLVVVLWTRGGIMALARFVGRRLSPAAKPNGLGRK